MIGLSDIFETFHKAFILTAETTHYRTMNKGETWSSFKTPLPPSLSANTLGFNAKKWDWILFTGQKCESQGGWGGKVCHDEVSYLLYRIARPVFC